MVKFLHTLRMDSNGFKWSSFSRKQQSFLPFFRGEVHDIPWPPSGPPANPKRKVGGTWTAPARWAAVPVPPTAGAILDPTHWPWNPPVLLAAAECCWVLGVSCFGVHGKLAVHLSNHGACGTCEKVLTRDNSPVCIFVLIGSNWRMFFDIFCRFSLQYNRHKTTTNNHMLQICFTQPSPCAHPAVHAKPSPRILGPPRSHSTFHSDQWHPTGPLQLRWPESNDWNDQQGLPRLSSAPPWNRRFRPTALAPAVLHPSAGRHISWRRAGGGTAPSAPAAGNGTAPPATAAVPCCFRPRGEHRKGAGDWAPLRCQAWRRTGPWSSANSAWPLHPGHEVPMKALQLVIALGYTSGLTNSGEQWRIKPGSGSVLLLAHVRLSIASLLCHSVPYRRLSRALHAPPLSVAAPEISVLLEGLVRMRMMRMLKQNSNPQLGHQNLRSRHLQCHTSRYQQTHPHPQRLRLSWLEPLPAKTIPDHCHGRKSNSSLKQSALTCCVAVSFFLMSC